ncbi:MAG TPA: lysophospholipid acyltransferase family protein [Gemmatimonadaceae bacterium]|nr:lysophospholipid acyltransferase family protein [Gemmatimonadaceae bacterium]
MIRTAWVLVVAIVATLICADVVIVAGLLRVEDRPGGVYDTMQRLWARMIVWAAGIRVVAHGAEHASAGKQIIVGNHVSWFDVLAVAAAIPRARFVAKREVRNIPLVGPAAGAAGHVYIERENRKAALEQYNEAAARIHTGARVIVFAEGTRGSAYGLRPFKKGPFVLAVSAQAPIVPMLVHGAMEVMPKGSFRVRGNRQVDIHFMPPIATTGLTYDDRNRLAVETRAAIAGVLERTYGIASPPWDPRAPQAPAQ